jgi:hypothetical protein
MNSARRERALEHAKLHEKPMKEILLTQEENNVETLKQICQGNNYEGGTCASFDGKKKTSSSKEISSDVSLSS